MSLYADPVIALLISKLDAEGPSALRGRYYQGDPLLLPKGLLPICFVSKDETIIAQETTSEDRHSMAVVLNVVVDFAKDLNQKSFVQAGTTQLYELCEGRDNDLNLRTDTIAYVLRKYQVLDSAKKLYIDIGTNPSIDYAISPPSRRGIYSVEAIIRLTLRHHMVRI